MRKPSNSKGGGIQQPSGALRHRAHDDLFMAKLVACCVVFVCCVVSFFWFSRPSHFSHLTTGTHPYHPAPPGTNDPKPLHGPISQAEEFETIELLRRQAMYYQHIGLPSEALMQLDLAINLFRNIPMDSRNYSEKLSMMINQRGVVLMLHFAYASGWNTTHGYRGVNRQGNPLLNPLDPQHPAPQTIALTKMPTKPHQPDFIPRLATMDVTCGNDILHRLIQEHPSLPHIHFTLRDPSHILDEAVLWFRCCMEMAPLAAQCWHNSAVGALTAAIYYNSTRFLKEGQTLAVKAMEEYRTGYFEKHADAYTASTSRVLDLIQTLHYEAETTKVNTIVDWEEVRSYRGLMPTLLQGSALDPYTTIAPTGGFVTDSLGVYDDDEEDAIFRLISTRPRIDPSSTVSVLVSPTTRLITSPHQPPLRKEKTLDLAYQAINPHVSVWQIATLLHFRSGSVQPVVSCNRLRAMPDSNFVYCERNLHEDFKGT